MTVSEKIARLLEMESDASGDWTIRPTSDARQSLLVRGDPYPASTQLPTEDAVYVEALRNASRPLLLALQALLLEHRITARIAAYADVLQVLAGEDRSHGRTNGWSDLDPVLGGRTGEL